MKKIIAIIMAALLIACLCACGEKKPEEPKDNEKDTNKETTPTEEKEEKPHETVVGFLGDSITLGYALDNKEARFSTLICQKLGVVEQNEGITGTLVAKAGLSDGAGTSFVERIQLIKDADIAVIFGGTNDYFWSDMPLCAPEDDIKNTAYFDVALDKICRYMKTVKKSEKTLLVTPYKHCGTGNFEGGENYRDSSEHETDAKNYNGLTLEDYVNKIIEIGKKHGIAVLDLYHTDEFDYKTMTIDGCHPNEDGHKYLAEKIGAEVEKLIG